MKGKGQIPIMKTIIGIILATILVFWFVWFMDMLGEGGGESDLWKNVPERCYEVTSHRDVSCQVWCEEYVEGEGGMDCDPELDCFRGGESHPVVVDRRKGEGKDFFGISCTREPWADGLVRCGCSQDVEGVDEGPKWTECISDPEDKTCSEICNNREKECVEECWKGYSTLLYSSEDCEGGASTQSDCNMACDLYGTCKCCCK